MPSVPLALYSSLLDNAEASVVASALEVAVTLLVLFLRAFAGSLVAFWGLTVEVSAIVYD